MKKFLLLLLIACGLQASAQVYNNEWINYSRTYYKFKVGPSGPIETSGQFTGGLYRITQPTLTTLGLASTPAEQFQIWRNGKEIPLYTSVTTGPLGGADFIEFWAQMNDGDEDSIMYRYPEQQLNKKWSLQTDTAAFYLTVNPAGQNKRLVNAPNVLPSALPIEPYFIHTEGKYFREKLNPGYAQVVGEYVYSSAYDVGEGYTTTDLGGNAVRQFNFPNLYPATGSNLPEPVFRMNASGNAMNPRTIEVKLDGNVVMNPVMDYFDYVKASATMSQAQIASGNLTFDITNVCATATDRMVIAQLQLTYARQFNFTGLDRFTFELPANLAGNYLEINGFVTSGIPPVLYDMTNGKRYIGDISAAPLVKIALEPSATPRTCVLVSQHPSIIGNVTSLTSRNFIDYSQAANQGNYLIITHPALTVDGPRNPVDDYRAYRSSATGGGYNVKVYMIDDLVDQFGLGIKKHPLSIRNFLRWARANFNSPVSNVLLMGKGVHYQSYRLSESNPDIERQAFVPTFGQPASDNLLAADPGLDNTPHISVGRISAITGAEITTYLNKVKQYEQQQAFQSPLIADKAWLKNVVHVIGAGDGALGTILTSDMEAYKKIIEDTFYGGNVSTFTKLTAAPVEQASSERLQKLFQEGIGIMTYFGHSSASTLEFNLDNPDQYNNPGKYPVTIVMGCNAGNFYNFNTLRFSIKETLSEKFVLADQRGSIAFIASSHFGIVHYLDIFNTRTYRAASISHYGKTLGEVLRESIAQTFALTGQGDYYARFHCEQTVLHGDPAIRFDGSTDKPDYAIEEPLVKVSPTFISVADDHFTVKAKMINLGKALNKDIVIEVKRTYPNLTTEVIRRDTIRGIRYADSLSWDIDIVPVRDKGLNKISICIDADNTVDEIFETNNCVTKDVFIFEDEARPVYPYALAIVKSQNIKLFASTANPFAGMKQYTMEMDTTEYFNSPSKITRTLSTTGGVMEFTPGITFTDSTVYYWRVAPVPTSGAPVWNVSSFVYLDPSGPSVGDYGFNQSHFFQHTKSSFDRTRLDTASRLFKFTTVNNNLFLKMGTFVTSGAVQEASLSVAINGIVAIRLTAWFQSLVFNVFDPISFRPWQNVVIRPSAGFPADLGEGKYKSHSPSNGIGFQPYNFEYRYTSPEYRKNAMNFMKDTIPDGHYVVVRNFSLDPATFPDPVAFPQVFIADWQADEALYGTGNTLYHYLKNAGFTGIDSFYRVRPWGFVYKKNDPSFTPRWLVGANTLENPTLSVDCPTIDTVGFVSSPLYGPAKAWKTMKWRGSSEPEGDIVSVDVYGVTAAGSKVLLYPNLTTAQQDLDISAISATVFPYVQLRMRTQDSIHYTPYQLRYWRVTYDPVPEGAIAPNLYMSVKDTVEVGEPVTFKVAFKNISDVGFDSVKVKLVLTDRSNLPHIIPMKRRPLPVGDTIQIGTTLETGSFSGFNTIFLEANPDDDQPEQYHFNNFAYRSLYVKPDSLNPLLDVTFDGVHILNRDIVSSKPGILIKLKDEAKWQILDDTSLLTLSVRYPNGVLRRFYFNNDTVRFIPAGTAPNPDNTATIDFKPWFALDGEYELIVTGKDKSNNNAGNLEYRVFFEVINKPMISNMLNYPNPFTSSTAFVFTITGNEVPQNIKIEIMTITGKIVREITKDELGPLHIGRNITEFKWDGTDQYGQKLANGVYLYRVVTNLNGKALDKYKAPNESTDKYFNKGYGKMYLMR